MSGPSGHTNLKNSQRDKLVVARISILIGSYKNKVKIAVRNRNQLSYLHC